MDEVKIIQWDTLVDLDPWGLDLAHQVLPVPPVLPVQEVPIPVHNPIMLRLVEMETRDQVRVLVFKLMQDTEVELAPRKLLEIHSKDPNWLFVEWCEYHRWGATAVVVDSSARRRTSMI